MQHMTCPTVTPKVLAAIFTNHATGIGRGPRNPDRESQKWWASRHVGMKAISVVDINGVMKLFAVQVCKALWSYSSANVAEVPYHLLQLRGIQQTFLLVHCSTPAEEHRRR